MTVTSKFMAHFWLYINILYMKFAMLSQEFKCNTEIHTDKNNNIKRTRKIHWWLSIITQASVNIVIYKLQ